MLSQVIEERSRKGVGVCAQVRPDGETRLERRASVQLQDGERLGTLGGSADQATRGHLRPVDAENMGRK